VPTLMSISNLVLISLVLVLLLVLQERLAVGRVLAQPDTSKVGKSLPAGRLFSLTQGATHSRKCVAP
jgi:hypothetical protein